VPLEEDLASVESATAEKATMISEEEGDDEGEQPASDDEEEDDPEFYVSGQLPLPFWNRLENFTPHCDHPRARPTDFFCIDCGQPLQIEQQIGEYQVIKPLGNSGTSYLAWRDRQTVVLKTIAVEGEEHLRLFQRRIKTICRLGHPGLPRVYEGFRSDDRPFLATEMVHGSSLWQWVSQHGPVSPGKAIPWMIQLCQTLAYLHQQDPPLVHQGICPSNLIRPAHPRHKFEIVLVDLGSVLLVTPEIKTFVHDVAYTAPELQNGHGQTSSDLYALGVTLAYLLTAQEPDYFFRWGTENYRLYVEDMPQLDPGIARLIHDLTHPQPELRPSSATVVARELQKLL
jgi:serine/threonine-protein kinase